MNTEFLSPVIKNSRVKLEGVFKIPIAASSQAAVAQPGQLSNAQPSAKLIETNDRYATIEVVCPCGTVSRIRCNYN